MTDPVQGKYALVNFFSPIQYIRQLYHHNTYSWYPEEQELILPKGKEAMTVVCALKHGESLYIAADSGINGLPTKQTADSKLEFCTNIPLAWAGSGDEAFIDQFSDWLRSFTANPANSETWGNLIDNCVAALAARNGVMRNAKQRNGLPLNPENDFAQILIVGFIESIPEIVHLEHDGTQTFHLRANRSFAAIGGGRYHASTAYEVLVTKSLPYPNGDTLIREVTEIAARLSPECSLPIAIAQITPEGVKLL